MVVEPDGTGVKVLGPKPDDVSSVSGSHVVEPTPTTPSHWCCDIHMSPHIYIHVSK